MWPPGAYRRPPRCRIALLRVEHLRRNRSVMLHVCIYYARYARGREHASLQAEDRPRRRFSACNGPGYPRSVARAPGRQLPSGESSSTKTIPRMIDEAGREPPESASRYFPFLERRHDDRQFRTGTRGASAIVGIAPPDTSGAVDGFGSVHRVCSLPGSSRFVERRVVIVLLYHPAALTHELMM